MKFRDDFVKGTAKNTVYRLSDQSCGVGNISEDLAHQDSLKWAANYAFHGTKTVPEAGPIEVEAGIHLTSQ